MHPHLFDPEVDTFADRLVGHIGFVGITTPSTPPGIDARLWYARSPSTSSAFGLTANTL